MIDGRYDIIEHLYTALSGVITPDVFTYPRKTDAYPYVVIGNSTMQDRSTKGYFAQTITVQLLVVTGFEGDSFSRKSGFDICTEILEIVRVMAGDTTTTNSLNIVSVSLASSGDQAQQNDTYNLNINTLNFEFDVTQ